MSPSDGPVAVRYVDALVAWGSVFATWLVARKVLENWLYWIVLDSLAACPPLSIIASQAIDQSRAQERVRLAPECAAKRAAWIASRTAALMQRTGMTEAEAKATLECLEYAG